MGWGVEDAYELFQYGNSPPPLHIPSPMGSVTELDRGVTGPGPGRAQAVSRRKHKAQVVGTVQPMSTERTAQYGLVGTHTPSWRASMHPELALEHDIQRPVTRSTKKPRQPPTFHPPAARKPPMGLRRDPRLWCCIEPAPVGA